VGLRLMDAVGRSGLPAWLKPYALVWARKANDDGTRCTAGANFVADYLGKQERQARRARNELIALGILRATTQRRYGRVVVKIQAFRQEHLPDRGSPQVGAAVFDDRVAGRGGPDDGRRGPHIGRVRPRPRSRTTAY
jgi:hypothetical protein